jgi:TRAP-type uncharacterized transport system substrate-binding protein
MNIINKQKEPVQIIAYADKTILKIRNIDIKGLNTTELENILMSRLSTIVRVIGVTGSSIEMDIYKTAPEDIYKNAQGIITALSLTEGITAQNVVELSATQAVDVDFDHLEIVEDISCARERWQKFEHLYHTDRE